MKFRAWLIILIAFLLTITPALAQDSAESTHFYHGVDLSYVNEMDDCGAGYHVDGAPRDPYQIFYDYGANLVRLRLWYTPDWTEYSTLDDVIRSMQRAEDLGMDVLLDFHYSDTWADPSKQIIPAAWANIDDLDELGDALYQYTYDVLAQLNTLGLMPEMVQVGNEINSEILRDENTSGYPINWERNAFLINQAIQAVRDIGAQAEEPPRLMLHVAQPESVEGWLSAAKDAGVTDYDIIGISYYPGWSDHSIKTAGNIINRLRYQFNKDVMIVETAYPWTLDGVPESASNILGDDFLLEDYPASPDGQRQFLTDLAQTVFTNGGLGIIYWEPAWVSTPCRTLWGQGSHWENATFFDFNHDNEILPGIEFLRHDYTYPVDVTLTYRFEGQDLPDQIYFWGDFTGLGRRTLVLSPTDGEYQLHVRLMAGTEIRYQFYAALPASLETALLPPACGDGEGRVSVSIPDDTVSIYQTNTTCPSLSISL
ncbi:MAG: arabinogalactan endo-1,4-beta-galactosidase [Anaerolineae bacterium]|nr:arabinogalactan endo-1,4-beta-galactosidase [Anaerolineae bacterium]